MAAGSIKVEKWLCENGEYEIIGNIGQILLHNHIKPVYRENV